MGFLSFLKKKDISSDILPQNTQSSQEMGLPPNPQEKTSPKHPAHTPLLFEEEEELEIPSLEEEPRHVDDFGVPTKTPNISELEVPSPPSEEEAPEEAIKPEEKVPEKAEAKAPEKVVEEVPETLPDLEEKKIEAKIKEKAELRKAEGPLFVTSRDFKAMSTGIDSIKLNLKTSEEILSGIEEIRMHKDSAYEKWARLLENIERKLIYVDKALFEQV